MMRSIEWLGDAVRFIDQSLLPGQESYVSTRDPEILIQAIRTLKVRGAPLIGVTAAYGVALSAIRHAGGEWEEFNAHLRDTIRRFAETRPTAVNLFWSLKRMEMVLARATQARQAIDLLIAEALCIHEEDAVACRRIGSNGEALIPQGARIITHCNTGILATGGDGTALSVVRTAMQNGKSIHLFIDETRPAFQGARLTTWECAKTGIPSTLITDSTAAFIMKERHIDLVIVGADRIAANGDVANKIGTYALAVLAGFHGIPFYIAAPSSTIDTDLVCGDDIVIEERHPDEIRHCAGVAIAPPDCDAFAPAFDRTPAELISAIITDEGVFRPPYHFSRKQAE